jgi:hypothetical protein
MPTAVCVMPALAQAPTPYAKINAAAAADPIEVKSLRGGISVLDGSGGNIGVLAGSDGLLMVDAGSLGKGPRIFSRAAVNRSKPASIAIDACSIRTVLVEMLKGSGFMSGLLAVYRACHGSGLTGL